jgi:predicted RNA-binding protein associated with RNAse of E/G family
MRKKNIDGVYVKRYNINYTSKKVKITEDPVGWASLIEFLDNEHKLLIEYHEEALCLSGKGYKWLNFFPESKYWALTVMYDDNLRILEWYIDITKSNFIDEYGEPAIDDLYLDVVVYPDGEYILLDEDELRQALESDEITSQEFDFAYNIVCELEQSGIFKPQYLTQLSNKLLEFLIR